MDVLITGSSGLIGSALRPALQAAGHRPLRLVRGATTEPDAIGWDPKAGSIDAASLEGLDAVVNLAGAGIGDHRWTDAYKREILESRTRTHRPPGPHPRRPRPQAVGPALGVGGRLLRRPGRRGAHRAERAGPRLPRRRVRGVGGGRRTGTRRRHPRGAPPHRHRPVARRRRAEEAAPAVQAVPRRSVRRRHASGRAGSASTTRSARSSTCSSTTSPARSTSPRRTR